MTCFFRSKSKVYTHTADEDHSRTTMKSSSRTELAVRALRLDHVRVESVGW